LLRQRDPEEVAAERAAELEQRLHGFLDAGPAARGQPYS
jgi:hypothetical protein